MSDPFFSIVIANFNYGKFLDQAIRSVLDQSCQDLELIVVDGASTDNSVDIIKEHVSRISWWVSEPDKGQSNALNKGFAEARGQLLTWLNADDILFPNALQRIKEKATCSSSLDKPWIVGGCFWLTPNLKVIQCSRARPFSTTMARWNCIPVWGPSSFFSKSLLDRVGGIDESFHYMMDTELWLRFHRKLGAIYLPVSSYCWGLRLHPDAKMSGHNFPESPKSDPNHPARQQQRKELELLTQRYGSKSVPLFVRASSALKSAYIRSRIDTRRAKGMNWLDAMNLLG